MAGLAPRIKDCGPEPIHVGRKNLSGWPEAAAYGIGPPDRAMESAQARTPAEPPPASGASCAKSTPRALVIFYSRGRFVDSACRAIASAPCCGTSALETQRLRRAASAAPSDHARIQPDDPERDAALAQLAFGRRQHPERGVLDVEHAADLQHDQPRSRRSSISGRIFWPTSSALAKKTRPSGRSTSTPGNDSSSGCSSAAARNTLRAALAHQHIDGISAVWCASVTSETMIATMMPLQRPQQHDADAARRAPR